MSDLAWYPADIGDPNVTIPFHGTRIVQAVGWTFHLRTHGPSLAAITLVTLLTLAAGVFAMMPIDHYEGANKNRKLQAPLAHAFNPTATMDILLASSAGDLAKVLSESDCDPYCTHLGDRDHYDHDARFSIVLGKTDKGVPALRTVGVDETRGVTDGYRRGSLVSYNQVRLGASDEWSSADVAGRDGFIELRDLQTKSEFSD